MSGLDGLGWPTPDEPLANWQIRISDGWCEYQYPFQGRPEVSIRQVADHVASYLDAVPVAGKVVPVAGKVVPDVTKPPTRIYLVLAISGYGESDVEAVFTDVRRARQHIAHLRKDMSQPVNVHFVLETWEEADESEAP